MSGEPDEAYRRSDEEAKRLAGEVLRRILNTPLRRQNGATFLLLF
jgi:hypothetical protein